MLTNVDDMSGEDRKHIGVHRLKNAEQFLLLTNTGLCASVYDDVQMTLMLAGACACSEKLNRSMREALVLADQYIRDTSQKKIPV